MAYRIDNDLEFLRELSSTQLDDLVYLLTHDKNGNIRLTEELTRSDSYKAHYPDHHQYWQEIAGEIQCFGANTFATLFRRGKGVLYKEILQDVCDKLKVNYNKDASTETIESYLFMKILESSLDKMSTEELQQLSNEFGLKNTNGITPQILLGSFQKIFQAGGFKSYQLTVIIANAIMRAIFGKGLSFAANATLTRTMSILTGPIGFAITAIWTCIDIASPAYRITIPAVIQVAYLRQAFLYGSKAEEINFN